MANAAEPALDPRVERSRRIILHAALDELAAVGYGRFALESVARRARVGKATVYRHWPRKLALIADAFETLRREVPGLESAPPRERVERLVRHVAETVAESAFSASLPALIEAAERDAQVREFHHGYCAEPLPGLVQAIGDGVRSGEIRPDLDSELAALALLGPIFFRRLMTGTPFDPNDAAALVDTVLGRTPEPGPGDRRRPTRDEKREQWRAW